MIGINEEELVRVGAERTISEGQKAFCDRAIGFLNSLEQEALQFCKSIIKFSCT